MSGFGSITSSVAADLAAHKADNATNAINLNQYPRITPEVDDTARIQRAINATPAYGFLIIPNQVFICSGALTVPNNITFSGMGDGSTLQFTGVGHFIEVQSNNHFIGLTVQLIDTSVLVTAFYVSNKFRCSWERVTVSGGHLATNLCPLQTGFEFRANAGDNRIINCDINNLGVGIKTDTIMNYVIGTIFGTCQYGIYGDAGTFSAGMSIESCTFVSDATATINHIRVDVDANVWWITNSWFEGAQTSIKLGDAVNGGPYAVGIINCKVAGTNYCIKIDCAKQTTLMNIGLSYDPATTPIEVYIDPINALNGTIVNLVSGQGFEVTTVFPSGWTNLGRGEMGLPAVVNGVSIMNGDYTYTQVDEAKTPLIIKAMDSSTVDLFEVQKGATTVVWIDKYNNFVITTNLVVQANVRLGSTDVHTIGFYSKNGVARQTITGAKGGNVALASLITALDNMGLVIDSTTA